MKKNHSIRIFIFTAFFAALAVLGSFIHFPIGPVKVFPFQHAINVVAGIIIGPWYGMIAAFLAALIRLMLGTGTIFAFPGGIPGAFVVGILYHHFVPKDWIAFFEPVGTVLIGATVSAYLVAPWMGMTATLSFFQFSFLISCFPGSVIGYLLIKVLRKLPWLNVKIFNGGE